MVTKTVSRLIFTILDEEPHNESESSNMEDPEPSPVLNFISSATQKLDNLEQRILSDIEKTKECIQRESRMISENEVIVQKGDEKYKHRFSTKPSSYYLARAKLMAQ